MPVLVPTPPPPDAGWPALTPDWQLEIGGLVLGAGTNYQISDSGLEGLGIPGVRVSDIDRPQDHGAFYGADYLTTRRVAFDLWLLGDDPDSALALIDAFSAVWQPPAGQRAVSPLLIRLPGIEERVLLGRPRRLSYDTARLRAGVVRASVEYEAADPRIYSSAEHTLDIALPEVLGGLSFPLAFPISWGSGTSGAAVATNHGNFPSRPTVVFSGQLVGLSLENADVGATFAMRDNFILDSGDTLVVDFDARTVLLNGTASRYGEVDSTSTWWDLTPGENLIRLGAISGDGHATVTYRSAWI